MAYILLAFGAVMSLAGLAAMYTGYPMIEIERGWATMITGAVLLSGGVVVTALGFVLRQLIGLRGALLSTDAARSGAAPQLFSAMPASPELPVGMAPALAASSPTPVLAAAAPIAAAALAAGTFAAHEWRPSEPETPHAAQDPIPDLAAAPASDSPVGHALVEAPPELEDHFLATTDIPAEEHALGDQPDHTHSHETHRDLAHSGPGQPEQELQPTDQEPVVADAAPVAVGHQHPSDAAVQAEAGQPRIGEDWLDQAFWAFDYELANRHPPAADPPNTGDPHAAHLSPPAAPEVTDAAPMHGATVGEAPLADVHPAPHETGIAAHEAPMTEAPATAPAEPATNLTVIGRYDSEGTCYVMYSDGSIEAQSEAGIYRFGSMAELKAFIEG